MKTIIAGGRDFCSFYTVIEVCDAQNITEVVSGKCKGADLLGEKYANMRKIPIKEFPADWNGEWGHAAGMVRNHEMAEYADQLIAFWDEKSNGTRNMINRAKEMGLNVHVYSYSGRLIKKEESSLNSFLEK